MFREIKNSEFSALRNQGIQVEVKGGPDLPLRLKIEREKLKMY